MIMSNQEGRTKMKVIVAPPIKDIIFVKGVEKHAKKEKKNAR